MTVEYARLGIGQARKLRELNRFFADVFPDPQLLAQIEPTVDADAQWLANDAQVALVAQQEGRIIAGLVAYRLDKIKGRREFYIYDLAVAEEFRRQGIATRLIDEVRAITRDCGA
jgi:aminoglycoside 3-N-acetyltransferase I